MDLNKCLKGQNKTYIGLCYLLLYMQGITIHIIWCDNQIIWRDRQTCHTIWWSVTPYDVFCT